MRYPVSNGHLRDFIRASGLKLGFLAQRCGLSSAALSMCVAQNRGPQSKLARAELEKLGARFDDRSRRSAPPVVEP